MTPPNESPAALLPKIDYDEDYDRYYIPLPAGWEVQTKGKGSTFRIVDGKGDHLAIPKQPYLHEHLERMAREIHAVCNASPAPAASDSSDSSLEKLACMLQALEFQPAAVNLPAETLGAACRAIAAQAKRAARDNRGSGVMDGWQPIASAPKDRIVAIGKHGQLHPKYDGIGWRWIAIARWSKSHGGVWKEPGDASQDFYNKPTHWRELGNPAAAPAPPAVASGDPIATEFWKRAISDDMLSTFFGKGTRADWIEYRARELAEGKKPDQPCA